MKNQTFTGSDPTWANACVGENGSPNYIQYSKGYSKAANLLLNNVLNTRGKEVDLYIYPICFNMRHSIELRVKGAIQEITELAKKKAKNYQHLIQLAHMISAIYGGISKKIQKS